MVVRCLQVGSKKELRHIRKKARRKAARAGNGPADPSVPDAPSTPPHDIPDPSEPDSAHNVKTNAHSTTDVKVRGLWTSTLVYVHL